MKKHRTIVAMAAVAVLASLAFAQSQDEAQEESASQAPPDAAASIHPIAFPHDIHAGQFQIDCQYCHFSAERSVAAGIPSVGDCMGCHMVVQGRNAPEEVAKLREYSQRGAPIPWVRVYRVSDHFHFPHMRHVNKDAGALDCTECHGEVTEIEFIEEVEQPLTMGWCVACHLEKDASRDCAVCHY